MAYTPRGRGGGDRGGRGGGRGTPRGGGRGKSLPSLSQVFQYNGNTRLVTSRNVSFPNPLANHVKADLEIEEVEAVAEAGEVAAHQEEVGGGVVEAEVVEEVALGRKEE